MTLTDSDKKRLLYLAASVIESAVRGNPYPGGIDLMNESFPDFRCGVFVSIYVGNDLRGCIGTFSEEESLHTNVRKMARSAAVADTRFDAIRPDELAQVKIEISILLPRRRIDDPSEIIIGRHGIYIETETNRGTLLPQVAEKENWTAEQFLGYCSKYKAGLGWDGWKNADVFVYEALIISS